MAEILLIHGSWHGAWCWYKVAPRLREMGHTVHTPDLPGHGRDWTPAGEVTLNSCLAVLEQLLSRSLAPVLVVAHSRGGLVLSALCQRMPEKIARAVYLAAVLLEHGQTVFDVLPEAKGSLLVPSMFMAEDQTWDMLREEAFDAALYGDCSPEDRALCHSLLTPEPLAPSLSPMSLSADRYGSVPRTYIELTEDQAVTLSWQRSMVARVGCDQVLSLAASHSAYFSRPNELSALIDGLTRSM